MKQFIAFVIKEAKHILRDMRTMLILFGMPVVMMLLFGFAITTDVKNVRTVVVTSQMDHLTQAAVERLAQSEYFTITQTVCTPQEAERLIRSQKLRPQHGSAVDELCAGRAGKHAGQYGKLQNALQSPDEVGL